MRYHLHVSLLPERKVPQNFQKCLSEKTFSRSAKKHSKNYNS
jgi:hypothetical protein